MRKTHPTHFAVVATTAVLFVVLGWTQGNVVAGFNLTEPVNWPPKATILELLPGVGRGACAGFISAGDVYETTDARGEVNGEHVVTEEEAERHNRIAGACRRDARLSGRDETKAWANWASIFLLAVGGLAIYDYRERRKRTSS